MADGRTDGEGGQREAPRDEMLDMLMHILNYTSAVCGGGRAGSCWTAQAL